MAKTTKSAKIKPKKAAVHSVDRCITCGGSVEGFKCDMCGAEFMERDEEHECGARHCMPVCVSCSQAQTLCNC